MSRIVIFVLALTLGGAACAYAYLNPGEMVLALLLASNGIWLLACLLLVRPERTPGTRSSPADSVQEVREQIAQIVARINTFVDEEVLALDESLQQIQSLAKDAVNALGKSMHSLNHQVRTQSRLLNEIAGITAVKTTPVEDGAWGQFVEDSRSVIEYFSKLLDEVSDQRTNMANGLRTVLQHASDSRKALDSVSARGGTTEIRIAIGRLRSLVERQISALESGGDWEKERSTASQAISRIDEARGKLHDMRDVVSMNVEAFKRQSHEDVGRAIRSLQFEDIVTQLVTNAQIRLDEVNKLIASLNSRVTRLELVADEEQPIGALEVVREIHTDVVSHTERLRASRQKAVAQQSMDEGTIELF